MTRRPFRRALVGAATIVVLSTIAAYADTVPADGDAVNPGNQTFVKLPNATPGQVVTWPITFQLTCVGLNHPAAGSTIQIDPGATTVPFGGDLTATSTSIGPVPDGWTPTGSACSSPAPTLASAGPSLVTLTMPTTPHLGYLFTTMWTRTGASNLTGSTAVTFQVDVVGNTSPTLHLPADLSAEATSPAGAAVSWTATATDVEDAVAPTPTCVPASGSTFPLGDTTVTCSATDGGGLSASGSFHVVVSDTMAPTLVGMPADKSLTTGDPSGTTLTYTPPTATDIADGLPTVECVPPSGSHVPVGTTTVTCTAMDASGAHSSASFAVTVRYVPPVTWTTTWGEPIGSSGSPFVANPGRTIPVKVEMLANGVEQTSGTARLAVAVCGGGPVMTINLAWGAGVWSGHLDTSLLAGPGCYVATARLDGNVAGSFRIDLRGGVSAAPSKGSAAKLKP